MKINITPPGDTLARYFIDFAEENDLSLKQAASILKDYAVQKQPLLKLERTKSKAEDAHAEAIMGSKSVTVVIRLHAKNRIYFLTWVVYTEYSMAYARPKILHWIRRGNIHEKYILEIENRWKEYIFLDDLYYAEDYEILWTPEPSEPPKNAAENMKSRLIESSMSKDYNAHDLVTLSPQIVGAVLRSKKGKPPIIRKRLDKINDEKYWLGVRGIGRPKNWNSLLKCIPYMHRRTKGGIL